MVKIAIDVTLRMVMSVPKLVIDNTQGGIETVMRELKNQMLADMAIKHGKSVTVETSVLEDEEDKDVNTSV
jgi:hypothetical protein